VGKGLGNLNVHDHARLPSALKTLYHLARLDRTVLLNQITQGAIHPTLTVRDAEELAALGKGKSKASSRRVAVERRLSNLEHFVRTTLQDWTSEERETARLILFELAQEIASYGNAAAVRNGCSADLQSAVSPICNRQGEEIASCGNSSAVPEPHASTLNGNRCPVSRSLELLQLSRQPSLL